ncbi:MAG: hypothetical protein EOM50_20800 [Erysipelotrichia bacterium]|nr:hypothetical protein [Erysipelotrichia bacterium]
MIMNLTNYKATSLTYPNGEYRLGTPAEIIDEGSFYRIDGTHIFDKFKIEAVDAECDKITIHMKDKDVILMVVKK